MSILRGGSRRTAVDLSLEELGLLETALLLQLHDGALSLADRSEYRLVEARIREAIAKMDGLEQVEAGSGTMDSEAELDTSAPSDVRQFAADFFAEVRANRLGERFVPAGDAPTPSNWFLNVLVLRPEHADLAWPLILELVRSAPDEQALADVAAGPLEDLVVHHGDRFSDQLVAMARENARFRSALSGVWGIEKLPSAAQEELRRLLDR